MDTDQPSRIAEALHAIEEIDRERNLHVSVVIAMFVLAAACGVYTFFALLDWLAWESISEHGALVVMSIAWVLLFPVWILAFLAFMSALNALGFRDLRGLVRNRLSELTLDCRQLEHLRKLVDARQWHHRRAFDAALDDLGRSA